MNAEPIKILSTAPIPGFVVPDAIRFDTISFLTIDHTPAIVEADRINALSEIPVVAVFTSANAVEAVGEIVKDKNPGWKYYCIGNSTKDKLLEYFPQAQIRGSALNSADLAELIIRDKVESVIFFCGNLRRDEIPQQLKQHNILLEELNVYKTVYSPVALQEPYAGILLFSPGAVESLFSINRIDPLTVMFSIGKSTAAGIGKHCSNKIITSRQPDKIELAQTAISYFAEKKNT